MRELGPVAQKNKELITNKINKLLKEGTYKDINDIRKRNPSLQEFCFNNKFNQITYSFSSQFTNDDYIELLKELDLDLEKNRSQENQLQETKIDGNVFVDLNNGEENKTLVGVDEVNKQDSDRETFKQEATEKKEANFQYINDIDINKLNSEQMQNLSVIQNDAIEKDKVDNTQVYFDEFGNMTNIVKDSDNATNNSNNYYKVDNINGDKELIGQESSNSNTMQSNAKVKVKTLSNDHKISAAFTNTLILSFIIGSFFGIVFLAIYTKVMH